MESQTPEPESNAPDDAALVPADGPRVMYRLHNSTLWLPLAETIIGVFIPTIIAMFIVGFVKAITGVTCFVLLPTAIYGILRYVTLRFYLNPTELVIESGFVFRRERRIPFDRVQEVEIHQGLLQRPLNLCRLDISTAGSDAQEASLSLLRLSDAALLKKSIVEGQYKPAGADGVHHPIISEEPDYVCDLTVRNLVIGGLTSNLVATLGAVVGAVLYFQLFFRIAGDWFSEVEEKIDGEIEENFPWHAPWEGLRERIPDLGPFNFITDFAFSDTLGKSISLALVGLLIAIGSYVIRYYAFRLVVQGNVITKSHGLLNYQHGSFSRDRIQAIKIEEGMLRRWFGLAAVRADSAGDRAEIDENKKRDVLVPVATLSVAHEVTRHALPGLNELNPAWERISPLAVMRGSKKGWLLVLLAMVQTYFLFGWFFLAWVPVFAAVYFLNLKWFQHTGFWLAEQHFLSRHGWLNRSTLCLPTRNIQNVAVRQSWFDRRLGLATLSIDTAGQSNTGGGPRIRHLPLDKARRLQSTLSTQAAESEFRW